MRVLSLFSGVGGFDMGLEAAGMTTVFQCEIDKHARAVLDHHWPDVPKWDDVTTLTGQHILEHTDGVDLVAWGSPCQDLSLAGKRAGLSGERSGLFHEGIRIIKELRELSNGQYPTWSVWENVVGALSSNGGADFGEVLHEMDEAGACFSEWAVLDAQYFGVPQRRRRVFVLSCFDPATAAGCPDKILVVGESSRGDSSKGKPAREDSAGEVADSFGAGSQQGYTDLNGVLRGTVTSKWAKGSGGPVGDEAYNLVVEQPPIVFSHTQGIDAQPSEIHTPPPRREGNGAAVAFTVRNREGKPGGGKVPLVSEDSSLTLQSSNDQVLFVEPFTPGSIGGYVDGVGTLRASGGDLGGGVRDIVGPLAARDYKGVGNQYVMENKLVVHEVSSRTE